VVSGCALEASLRVFETTANSSLIGIKKQSGDRQELHHDIRPEGDGTYVVEFRTADGEALANSIPPRAAHAAAVFPCR
jgi:hypothetical protein